MLLTMTPDELNKLAEQRLKAYTPITNTKPGSRAKALLKVFNEIMGTFYTILNYNVLMGFVSKAEGIFLDYIGEAFNCSRPPGETDDNYRYLIKSQTARAAAANETAVRLATLSTPGVSDVRMRPYTFGTGSGTVYIEVDDLARQDAILLAAQANVDEVKAFGNRVEVALPNMVDVVIAINVAINDAAQGAGVAYNLKRAVKDAINALDIGEGIVMTRLFDVITHSSPNIRDFQVTSLLIGGEPTLIRNVEAGENDRLYVSSIGDVTVSTYTPRKV